jgi:hypothetical protein
MTELIETFYSDLRKAKEGKFAIFLGAGSSYDYGIPTMEEMATMLLDEFKSNEKTIVFDDKSKEVLRAILGLSEEKKSEKKSSAEQTQKWNIEDLLTRLQRIIDATEEDNPNFSNVTASIAGKTFSKEDILSAESKLVEFMVRCYQLDAAKKTAHGDKSVEYLSNFLEFIGEFHNSISIFTTNNDLCIEAAIMRLSQRQRSQKKKDFYLVDGFSHGILPTYSISYFSQVPPSASNRVVVYLWKLHGSIDWIFFNPINRGQGQDLRGDSKTQKHVFDDESIICRNIDRSCLKQFQDAFALSKDVDFDNAKIMIFPTPSKYSQTFNNPYMDLYQAFRRTLEAIELLLVIGTSFPDGHVNSAIKSFLSRDSSIIYIVDPNFKKEDACKRLGDCSGIQPIIQVGFKDFISEMQKIETSKEEDKEGGKDE